MSPTNYLRFGIILTVTGVIALVHFLATTGGRLPRPAELVIAIVLIVVGTPLLVVAVRRHQTDNS